MFRWLRRWRTRLDDDAADTATPLSDVDELEELTRILRETGEAFSLDNEDRRSDDVISITERRRL
jgi:hypothetical protein